jgi:hypothetical protein
MKSVLDVMATRGLSGHLLGRRRFVVDAVGLNLTRLARWLRYPVARSDAERRR